VQNCESSLVQLISKQKDKEATQKKKKKMFSSVPAWRLALSVPQVYRLSPRPIPETRTTAAAAAAEAEEAGRSS